MSEQQVADTPVDAQAADDAPTIDPVAKAATIADQLTELDAKIADLQTAKDNLQAIAADPAQDAPPSVDAVIPASIAEKRAEGLKSYFSGISAFAHNEFINVGNLAGINDIVMAYNATDAVAVILKAYGGK